MPFQTSNAKVFVNGKATTSTGRVREYVSRGLKAGSQYKFEIRAELDPTRLAQQLMVGLAGSAALVKGLITTDEVMELLESTIDLWT